MFRAIAAVAENGAIGCGGKIPWHISDEFRHFKRTTLGGVVAMGRKTWESLGARPLPGRENVVITSRPENVSGARAFKSAAEFAEAYKNDPRDVWICGGAKIYAELLDLCEDIILSRIRLSPEGDAFFPDISGKFEKSETILKHPEFEVVRYARIKNR